MFEIWILSINLFRKVSFFIQVLIIAIVLLIIFKDIILWSILKEHWIEAIRPENQICWRFRINRAAVAHEVIAKVIDNLAVGLMFRMAISVLLPEVFYVILLERIYRKNECRKHMPIIKVIFEGKLRSLLPKLRKYLWKLFYLVGKDMNFSN